MLFSLTLQLENGVWINGIFFYLAARKTEFGQNVFSLTLQLENGVWIKGIFFTLRLVNGVCLNGTLSDFSARKRCLIKWYFL